MYFLYTSYIHIRIYFKAQYVVILRKLLNSSLIENLDMLKCTRKQLPLVSK